MSRVLVLAAALLLAACGKAPPPSMAELCKVHVTDKCAGAHGYVEFYQTLFEPLRAKVEHLLEIGIGSGQSLKLWEAYFPAAHVYGLDIVAASLDSKRISTAVADQGKRAELAQAMSRFGVSYDIVIDDGGHRMDQQQVSFAVLFPKVKSGGLYVIEDVHTSFPDLYPDFGVDPDGANSTYAMIDRFVRTNTIRSKYLSEAEAGYLSANIAWCTYYFRPTKAHSDMFVCRKK